jgi:hypothetical protein
MYNTWHQRFAFYFLGPITGIGLTKCVRAAHCPWIIYSVRPVDKTSLTPFFVASMRLQPSKLISKIGSWSSASQMLIVACEISIKSSAWTTPTSSPSHWIRHWCIVEGMQQLVWIQSLPSKTLYVLLLVNDEERGRDSLVSNGQIHTKDPWASDVCPLKSLSVTLVLIIFQWTAPSGEVLNMALY